MSQRTISNIRTSKRFWQTADFLGKACLTAWSYQKDMVLYCSMADEKGQVQVLVRLSPEVHKALLRDAERCRRSTTRQVEAILTAYYELENVELRDVATARRLVSPQLAETLGGEQKHIQVPIIDAPQAPDRPLYPEGGTRNASVPDRKGPDSRPRRRR